MSDDFISCDFPDLDAFIKKLDLMDENVNAALRTGLNTGADIIISDQRRRIRGKSRRLAQAITKGGIYTTSSGGLGIKTGYQDDAFKTEGDGFNAGVVGMTFEFGRPGQSSAGRRSDTMTQTRHGKRYKVKKGSIQPLPHIRSGFDASVNAASQAVIDAYNREIDKLGD